MLAGRTSNARCRLCAPRITSSPEGPEIVENFLPALAKAENAQPHSDLDNTHIRQDLEVPWWPPGPRGSHNAGSIHPSVTLDLGARVEKQFIAHGQRSQNQAGQSSQPTSVL